MPITGPLTEEQVPAFVARVLGTLGTVLAKYGDNVLYRNTWGDGIFLVLKDASVAARCALELQAALAALDLPAHGLPDTLSIRLGGTSARSSKRPTRCRA